MTPVGSPRFLSIEEVLLLHARQLELYGGLPGARDLGLLQSAVAMPQAGVGGTRMHETLEEMTAAYLSHIAKNHAFVDGNKRAAAVAMIVFLRMNGLTPTFTEDELVELTLGVAAGAVSKSEAALAIEAHVRPDDD